MSETAARGWSQGLQLVMSGVMAISIGFLAWTAQAVYQLNADIHAMKNQVETNTKNINDIQQHGSPVIQSIMAQLQELQRGQARIEKALDDHMKVKP